MRELRRAALIDRDRRVLVAVSGGPDSTALLIGLREEGFDVVAAHYDHALQAASAATALLVAKTCQSLGVQLVVERRTAAMPRGSVQGGARALRYDFLGRAADATGADVVALGHIADDVVEGVVLHLLRGCGIAGLRGMPARRGRFVRPLLGVWRHEVVSFLDRRAVDTVDDPANCDPRHARVRVRHRILPALERDRPGIVRRLYAVALAAAAAQESLTAEAASAAAGGTVDASVLLAMPEPVAAEVLRHLYRGAGGADPGLARSHIESMLRLARGGRGGRGVDLPRGLRFRVVGSRASVVPRVPPSVNVSLEVRECGGCSVPHAIHLRRGLELRLGYRTAGLRMRPSGGRGTRKLQDLFVDARVPREERDTWPLVFAGDRLAWVPGVAAGAEFVSGPSEPSLHVSVARILSAGSPDSRC